MAGKRGNGDRKRPPQGRGLGGSVLRVRDRRPPYPYTYGKPSHRHSEHAGGFASLLTFMVYGLPSRSFQSPVHALPKTLNDLRELAALVIPGVESSEDVVASICFRRIVGPTTAALGYRRGTPPAVTNVVDLRGNRRMSRRILRPFPQVGRMTPTLPGAPPGSGKVMPHPPIDLL